MRILLAFLAALLWTNAASAQSLKDQLVGTWNFTVAEITTADGKKTFPFGEHPKGQIIFTADGHFSQVHVSSELPKIAGNNRLAGTDADYRAISFGSLSFFGTYTVDDAKKTVTFNITASTYPNAAGTSQTRSIDKLTAGEFVNTNPGAARDSPARAANYYTRAK